MESDIDAVLGSLEEGNLAIGIGVVFLGERRALARLVLGSHEYTTNGGGPFTQDALGEVYFIAHLDGLGDGHIVLVVVVLTPLARQRQGGEVHIVLAQNDIDEVGIVVKVDSRQFVVGEIEILQVAIVGQVDVCQQIAAREEINEFLVLGHIKLRELGVRIH